MIIVSGKATVPAGAIDKMRDVMEATIIATRKEQGCIDYRYGIDVLDPNTIVVVEYWEDWASLQAHFTTPHIQEWVKALSEAGVVARDIKFIEAGEERRFFD